jgi:hypothetical protein
MLRFIVTGACVLSSIVPLGLVSSASDLAVDAICPSAVPKVAAFGSLPPSSEPKQIETVARAAFETYLACYNRQKFAGLSNPSLQREWMNYDQTKAAQFLVIVGRCQAAQGKPVDAAVSLKQARAYTLEVIEWVPPAQTIHGSSTGAATSERNNDHSRSRWYDTAVAVRDAADAELAKLAKP